MSTETLIIAVVAAALVGVAVWPVLPERWRRALAWLGVVVGTGGLALLVMGLDRRAERIGRETPPPPPPEDLAGIDEAIDAIDGELAAPPTGELGDDFARRLEEEEEENAP